MSEHTDLLPLRSPEEGGPAFELVRRGYDRDQVENHLGWLEDQLRNTEIARDAAEQAAATAAAEAEAARDELERGRPKWHELGDRITQILTLAEDQGDEIRTQRAREAEELLADARQSALEADRIQSARIRDAEAHAEQTISAAEAHAEQTVAAAEDHAQRTVVTAEDHAERTLTTAEAEAERTVTSARAEAEQTLASARAEAEDTVAGGQAEADRLLLRAQQEAAEAERVASRRVADLERQRDAVNAQLTRLHETLAQALSPAIAISGSYVVGGSETPSTVLSPEVTGSPTDFSDDGYEEDDYAGSAAAPVPSGSAARVAGNAHGRK